MSECSTLWLLPFLAVFRKAHDHPLPANSGVSDKLGPWGRQLGSLHLTVTVPLSSVSREAERPIGKC